MKATRNRLPDLPRGWAWTTLGEVQLDKSWSITPKKSPDEIFELYSVPSFSVGGPEIVPGSQIGSGKRVVERDTVLLCKINPRINRVWVVGRYSPWQKIASTEWIPFFKLAGIDPSYLCYFMRTGEFRDFLAMRASGVGGSLMRVKAGTFAAYPLPLAPVAEEQRIVSKIEELFTQLDAAVTLLERARAQLRRYRQAVLKAAVGGELTKEWREAHRGELEPASVLLQRITRGRKKRARKRYRELPPMDISDFPELPEGWVWTNVADIGDTIGGLTKNQKRKTYPQRMPYLRVANVYAGELRLDDVKTIGVKKAELERVLLEKGDLLVVEGNGSLDQIGRVALWDGRISPCVHQNHIIKVRFYPVEVGRMVLYWLLSDDGREHITRVASSTSGLYTLSLSKVAALPVPLPPLSEQRKIVEEIEHRLSVVDQMEKAIEQSGKRAERLGQSILKRAFEGKLVPQDPTDEPASMVVERINSEKAGGAGGMKDQKKERSKRTPQQLELI